MKSFWSRCRTAILFTFCTLPAISLAQMQEPVRTKQGWNSADAFSAYSMPEGSELIPLNWFLSLEQNDSTKKFTDSLGKFGFISGGNAYQKSAQNPYHLPVGFAVDDDLKTQQLYGEKRWVGLNCAACHTGQVEINGRQLLIEGGQSLFDIQKFELGLFSAVDRTVRDDKKFDRFASSTSASDKIRLRSTLTQFRDEFGAWIGRNHKLVVQNNEIPYGPGRGDGLSGPYNDVVCHLTDRMGDPILEKQLSNEKNCQQSFPPTSLPHLWGITDMEWVQWGGFVHSSLGRNFGQSTGTYGKNWVEKGPNGEAIYQSTVKVKNLATLESYYDKLTPPSWKDLAAQGVVDPINYPRAQAGKSVFAANCIACHSVQPEFTTPNAFLNSYWKVSIVPPSMVGTDPYALIDNYIRTAELPALLAADFKNHFPAIPLGADLTVPVLAYRGLVINGQINSAFRDLGLLNANGKVALFDGKITPPIAELAALADCRESDHVQTRPPGYKARSLEGVLFTAPFLHNGSVPTIEDLLKPESERPAQFYVGCRKYDVAKLGYDCDANSEGAFLMDTTAFGNSNKGHIYGVQLNKQDKLNLIEFLKSLEQPQRPPKNPLCH